ncbi:MAG: lactate permease LctP family transporter [Verrucomicrobiae bacterium]|nr:lactate permease LctP family transporter [Verrucomicrobiae bacterium]
MWQQNYAAVGGNLWASAAVAALPILLLFYLLGVRRLPAWQSALAALAAALAVACLAFGTPVTVAVASVLYGAAFGLFPICWIVLAAIFLYRLTVGSGQFEVIKDSIARLTDDARLHVLLIAFAFGAFVEGAAGFGAPVAIAGAMLAGVGVNPFYAAALCLLANTAPVAFGSIGIPIVTLHKVTELPLDHVSAMVGRISPILSLIIPCYLMMVFAGWRGTRAVLPAVFVVSAAFAGVQFAVANFIGPYLTDILASLAAVAGFVVLVRFWKPANNMRHPEEAGRQRPAHGGGAILKAWMPYLLIVVFVILWGVGPLQERMGNGTLRFDVPGLHERVQRVPPVVKAPAALKAVFEFNWLSAAGTACMIAAILGGLSVGLRPRAMARVFGATLRQLALPALTIASVLGFAFLMNYSGMTATLGLALAATGWFFPFFSAFLGWLGVFVTGSDTSANALFGSLQVITAERLGLNPLLTAATNSAAGVMGKMISLQSIAVAVAATGMPRSDESRLFRWAIKHSLLLTAVIGLIAMLFAHAMPWVVPR